MVDEAERSTGPHDVSTGPSPRPADPRAVTVEATTIDSFVREVARAPAPVRIDVEALAVVAADRYVERREIARGGMGRISAARDARLDRAVALKELRADLPQLRRRFAREARLSARLQHPSIVSVLEAGRWPTGEPFYAMPLIAGRPLDRAIDEAGSLDARLGLLSHVVAAAEALAFAHEQRVIHRDLKPHNVMVGRFGETVVIDWGVAKQLDAADGDDDAAADGDGALTSVGAVIGTPAFMPPEQARGEPVDERADVYALGAILYHLLAGHPPYQGDRDAVLRAVAAGPPPPLPAVTPGVPRDLAAVVARAMAPAPRDRYRTAHELTADLRAFLTGQLVSAHHYSTGETLRRWLARHRNAVAVAMVLTAALVVTAAISIGGITHERDRATSALAALRARDAELAMRQAESALGRDPTEALAWLKQAVHGGEHAWRARALAEDAIRRGVARQLVHLDGAAATIASDGQRLVLGDVGGGLWTWRDGALVRLARGRAGEVAVALAGRRAVVGDAGGEVHEVDVTTGQRRSLVRGAAMRQVAIDGDGAPWSADRDGVVRGGPAGPAAVVARLGGAPSAVALGPGGAWAIGREDGVIVVGGAGAPRSLAAHSREVGRLVFVDATTLISGAEDGRVLIWDLASGSPRELGRHDEWVAAMALAPDRRRVATGSADGTVRIWSLDGAPPQVLRAHVGTVWSVAWAADGRLASGGSDGVIRVWRADLAATTLVFGHAVRQVAWVGDALVAAGGTTARVFVDLPAPATIVAGPVDGAVTLAASVDGRWLAVGGRGGDAKVWDLDTGRQVTTAPIDGWTTELAFAPGHLVVAGERGVTDVELGAAAVPRAPLVLAPGTAMPRVFPDGARAAWIDGHAGGARLLDLGTGGTTALGTGTLTAIAITADGGAVVGGARDGAVTAWPITGGAPRALGRVARFLNALIVGPGDRWVAGIPASGPVWVAPLAGGGGHALPDTADARSLIFVDAEHLALAVGDDVIVSDLATGARRVLRGHRGEVRAFAVSPDRAALFSVDARCEVREWRLADGGGAVVRPGGDPACLLAAAGPARVAIHSPRGVELDPRPGDVAVHDGDLAAWLEATTGAVIGADLGLRGAP
jgi:WD40 repeat protein/tRNA A-37 threonylcarbamoyl transferase component Bud32